MTKLSFIEKGLYKIAGAEPKILEQQNHGSDRATIAARGSGLIVKSVLAACSGGFALSTVFASPLVAIPGGILWGYAMYNVDKNMIATSRKRKQSDPVREVPTVLFKLLIATLTGYVVAVPLQLQVFQDTIESRIASDQARAAIEVNQLVAKAFPEIEKLEQEKEQLLTNLARKADQVGKAYQLMIEEAEGVSGTRREGKGPVYEDKQQRYRGLQQEYKILQQQTQSTIQEIEQQLFVLEQQKKERIRDINKAQDVSDLITQLNTLQQLSEEYPAVGYAQLLISMIFIGIDISPVLATILAKRSPYDAELERIETESILESETQLLNTRYLLEEKRGFQNKLVSEALKASVSSEKFQKVINEIADEALDSMADSVREVVNKVYFKESQIESAVKKTSENALDKLSENEFNRRLKKSRISHVAKEVKNDLNQYVNSKT